MSTFFLKTGDRLPRIEVQLLKADGSAFTLTGYAVKFLMRRRGETTVKVNAAAVIVDAALGQVAYAWAATDTDTPGRWEAEWQVTRTADGFVFTVPPNGYDTVVITAEIGS